MATRRGPGPTSNARPGTDVGTYRKVRDRALEHRAATRRELLAHRAYERWRASSLLARILPSSWRRHAFRVRVALTGLGLPSVHEIDDRVRDHDTRRREALLSLHGPGPNGEG